MQSQIRTTMSRTVLSRRGLFRLLGATGFVAISGGALAGCAPDAATGGSASASGTKIKVVSFNGAPPYCYLDDAGNAIGYDIDVLKAVDERLDDYYFEVNAMGSFDSMITAVQSGSAEFASCQLVPNEERKEKFIFCEEPYCLSPMVFVTADPNCKTLDDMKGKTVLCSPSNYEYGMLEEYNKKYPDKAVELVTSQNTTQADSFRQIASGQVDSTWTYDGSFDQVNEEAQTHLYKTDVVMCESTYFMFHKGQEKLRDACDEVLREMKKDGSLGKISEKDLGTDVFTAYADTLSDNELMS